MVVGYCEGCDEPLRRCSRCDRRLTWYCGCGATPTYSSTTETAGEAVSRGLRLRNRALPMGRIMPAAWWQHVCAREGELLITRGGQLGREWRAGVAWGAEWAQTAPQQRRLVRLRGGAGGDTPYEGEEVGPEDVPAMAAGHHTCASPRV